MKKLDEIKIKLHEYKKLNDVHSYQLILDAATLFIDDQSGVKEDDELQTGIYLLRELNSVSMIASLREYEHNYDLQNEILYKRLSVFRSCIPDSHSALRGLVETFVGMRENELDSIEF